MSPGPAETTPVRDWIEGLNKDLVVAAGLVGTLGLATGFMLTWARVASEDIPAQPILGALPTSYYVTVAIRSMLAPLMNPATTSW